MKTINPKTVKELESYWDNNKHPSAIALYKSPETETVWVLNPFGGGIVDTQECTLNATRSLKQMLPFITIVELN